MSIAASIFISPYFGPSALIAGLLWLIFVGEAPAGVQRYHWARYLGWSVVSVCMAAVAVTAGYGYIEFYIRQEADKIALGIPRGTPDENNPTRPQTPLYANNRDIQPDQFRILVTELAKDKGIIPIVVMCTAPNDLEAQTIMRQFFPIFSRSGIPYSECQQDPRGPDEEGFLLEIESINNIPAPAQKLMEAFQIANIPLKLIEAPAGRVNPNDKSGFVFYIAPRPLKWR